MSGHLFSMTPTCPTDAREDCCEAEEICGNHGKLRNRVGVGAMILSFGPFELDDSRSELRQDGIAIPVEGRVLALLSLLLQNHDRMVSKDEIVDVIWDGRAISDSAISTAIKEARRAVGDDGSRQQVIRTVHGRGFRCVADVRITTRAAAPSSPVDAPGPSDPPSAPDTEFRLTAGSGKPSIAVLPFQKLSPSPAASALADGVPAELISALSRLRWLDVVARGSSFRFREAAHDPNQLRDILGVGYCLSGIVELSEPHLSLTVELTETAGGVAIWGDRFQGTVENLPEIRAGIVGSLIAALETHIPQNEVRTIRLDATGTPDAWSAYHLGLQHMYRFNRPDNDRAADLFRMAIEKEPGFSRAHAGLSFTHFQNAFLNYGQVREEATHAAQAAAQNSLDLDFLDPFANYCMGRACWLTGDLNGAIAWLDRSVEISPNYAQAIYVRGLMEVLAGRSTQARVDTSRSMTLSPLDPLQYAMLASHAQSYMLEGDHETAKAWSVRATRAPRAHHLIPCIAALTHQLAGDTVAAQNWAQQVRSRRPDMSAAAFFGAFPFAEGQARESIERALRELGF